MPEYRPENFLMLIFYSKENVNSFKVQRMVKKEVDTTQKSHAHTFWKITILSKTRNNKNASISAHLK